MRWFNRPRSTASPSPEAPASPRAAELGEAWSALAADNFDGAISLASQYLEHPSAVGTEAHKLVGLAAFRKADYAASMLHMERVAPVTNRPDDWFNLCTSATMAGDIGAGVAAFTQAISTPQQPNSRGGLSVPHMRFHFAQALTQKGQFALALTQLAELRRIYETLRITDDTFVFIRGVPMLSHTMEVALAVFRGLGVDFPASQWLIEFATNVDEDGARYLRACAARLEGAT